MSPNSTGMKLLTDAPWAGFDPAWSQSGGRIASTTNRDSEVFVMSVVDTNHDGQGDNPKNLSEHHRAGPCLLPERSQDRFPERQGHQCGVLVMDATTGGAQTNLAQSSATDLEAGWQALP